MTQTLTDNFGGLNKNMNCAFPITTRESHLGIRKHCILKKILGGLSYLNVLECILS